MVGQFPIEVNRKDEPIDLPEPRRCRRQNRQKCGRFIPALTTWDDYNVLLRRFSLPTPTIMHFDTQTDPRSFRKLGARPDTHRVHSTDCALGSESLLRDPELPVVIT